MVRVRRAAPARRIVALLVLTLAAFLWLSLRRGDPVDAILSARDAERTRVGVTFDALELHAVRTAVCDSEEAARVEAARYMPRGAAGYVLRREAWHVLACGYETAAEAERVRDHLREAEGMTCDAVSLVCEPVRLRVTATAEQTEALTACEEKLRGTATLVGALSGAIDRGDASVSQALGVLKSQREQLCAARKRLESAAGERIDAVVCGPLAAMARQAEEGLDALTGDGSMLPDTLFSGRMKALFLALRVAEIEYLSRLGG